MARWTNPRADPIRLSKKVDVTPTTSVEPGGYVAVDGIIEDVAVDHHADDVVPSPETIAPPEPRRPAPTGSPSTWREMRAGEDTVDGAVESLSGEAVDPAVLAYGIETPRPLWNVLRDTDRPYDWVRLYQGVESVPFRLSDGSGSVRIAPSGSDGVGPYDAMFDFGGDEPPPKQPPWHVASGGGVDYSQYLFEVFPVAESAAAGDTPRPSVAALLAAALEEDPEPWTLRHRERAVGAGDAAYVLGWATERDGEVVVTPPEPGGTFLVSARRLSNPPD